MDLQALFAKLHPSRDGNLLVGMETADDGAVYRLSDDTAIVHTADFITPVIDDPFLFGQVAAANSLSDVYAMGGKPLTAINLCCFPAKGIEQETLAAILQGGLSKIEEAGAFLAGGHTVRDAELKYGLSVLGTVHPGRMTPNSGAKPGDLLILTKPVGTGIIITAANKIDTGTLREAVDVMSTLNRTACECMLEYKVRACTDITGFGLAGHGMEMAAASKVALKIMLSDVPRFPEALPLLHKKFKAGFAEQNRKATAGKVLIKRELPDPMEEDILYDPQTSGGLLISVREEDADALLTRLRERGVGHSKIIGEVVEAEPPHIQVLP